MRQIVATTLLAAGLALAAPALLPLPADAAVAEYGAEGARFSIDIPDGWKTRRATGGVQVVSPDRASLLVVMLVPAEGAVDADAMARNYLETRPGAVLEQADSTWLVRDRSTSGRDRVIMSCTSMDSLLLLRSFSGRDQDALERIAATVQVIR